MNEKIIAIMKKFAPLWVEIVESGLLLAMLMAFKVSEEQIAYLIVLKGLIKGYYLKNVRMKKENTMNTTIDSPTLNLSETEETPKNLPANGKISLEDRVGVIVKHLSEHSKNVIGRNVYTEESLTKYILKELTKSEEDIRKEAISKLSPLQKKALGIN